MSACGCQYGFRYDSMEWVEKDTSAFAALARTQVFNQTTNHDKGILENVINRLLSQQRPDGSFGGDSKDTGSKLLDLLELGIEHRRPEVQRAAAATVRQIGINLNSDEGDGWDPHVLSIYAIHALWILGKQDLPEVTTSLKWLLDHQEKWNDPWKGCPWTPAVFLSALWTTRDFPGASEAVRQGLRRVLAQMNDAGSCAYNDPWGLIGAASRIDLPEARELIQRAIPMILRNQRPGGHWRHRSLETFRGLKRHGFFEALCNLPPLPPDWTTVHAFSLPEGKWVSLTWDGRCIWSFDRESKRAAAFQPTDGRVIQEIHIDQCDHIAWSDGSLLTVCNEPKVLQVVDTCPFGAPAKSEFLSAAGDHGAGDQMVCGAACLASVSR